MSEKYDEIYFQLQKYYRRICSMRPIPEIALKRFTEDFSIGATHNSTAIEGNTFTFDETMLLLKEGVVSNAHPIEEHNEIMGYKKAFDYLYKALKENKDICENFIKKIHSFVFYGKEGAGEYRDIQVFVGDIFNTKYTPPPAKQIPSLMSEYVKTVNNDLGMLYDSLNNSDTDFETLFNTLAKHHIEFERIHPFVDGNGRAGRLLLTYEMIRLNLLPVDIRYEEKERYYAGLKNYEKKSKYSTNDKSKTEGLANLLAECESRSMKVYLEMFSNYLKAEPEM